MSEAGPPPDLLLVIGCTVRRDFLGPYGGPAATPHLDRWAAQGLVFDDLQAAAPWTKASLTAVLTGRHAVEIGLIEPGPNRNSRRLPDDVPTLAERLVAAGWRALGGAHNPNLAPAYGLHRGHDPWVLGVPDGPLDAERPSGLQLVRDLEPAVAATPLDRPLLMTLVLADPHGPRVPGVEAYLAGLARLDQAVGAADALLDALRPDRPRLRVFLSDHGEGLSPGERAGHGLTLDPWVVDQALILSGPGLPAGERWPRLGSGRQLGATLLDQLGLPASDWPGPSLLARAGPETVPVDTWFYGANAAALVSPDLSCRLDFGSRGISPLPSGCCARVIDPTCQVLQPGPSAAVEDWRQGWAGVPLAPEVTTESWLDRALEALGYRASD